MVDINAALVEQVLDIAKRKQEPDVKHHGQADDFRAGFELPKWVGFSHPANLKRRQARLKSVSFDTANCRRLGVE